MATGAGAKTIAPIIEDNTSKRAMPRARIIRCRATLLPAGVLQASIGITQAPNQEYEDRVAYGHQGVGNQGVGNHKPHLPRRLSSVVSIPPI